MESCCVSYIDSVRSKNLRVALLSSLFCLLNSGFSFCAELPAESAAAFDRYIKLTEDGFKKPPAPHNWLWLDRHPNEQSLVWLDQTAIVPMKTLEDGKEIAIPGASLQDWLGAILLEGATLERVRDFLLNYTDYKFYFKQFFTDSRQVKREGDTFDAFVRLSRKQFSKVILNINLTANYAAFDATHGYILSHSTHIGEVANPKAKEPADQERPAAEANGYLWRFNQYWRIQQSSDGVYVEVESVTLTRPAGGISPARFLNGFVQDFPKEYVEGLIEGLRQAFPRPKK